MRYLVLLVAVLGGCMKTSAKYCATHDDPEHCPAADAPGGGACTISDDCDSPTPECDTANHVCVECVTDSACTVATRPVCTSMHTCGACHENVDCADSMACMPDGSCAAMNDVAYVSATGGGSACTRTAPCDKVSRALMTGKSIIRIEGAIDESVTIDDRASLVTVIGEPGARLFRGSGTVMTVSGTSNVRVYRLTIGGPSATPTVGISMAPGSVGSLDVQRSTVTNHGMGGIRVEDGRISISQSTVLSNLGGGVIVRSGSLGYTIRNNFIIDNGKGSNTGQTSAGGVLLETLSAGTFEYNTVAFNGSNGTARPGLQCAGTSSAIGNIIVANADGINGTQDFNQAGGTCDLGNTYAKASATVLGFKSLGATPDLHLTAGSPMTVRDIAGDCSMFVSVDVDDQHRPYNVQCDLGADEYMP
ncbi:hypothetical protein BH11MYX3_BH11MYX3_30360 [soil metagenome]